MDIDKRLQEAVQSFWTGRDAQADKQREAGKVDAGIRGAVTGGQHMGALETLVVDILIGYWERDGVLRFEGEPRDDGHVTAWEALCEELGVASATARKALRWMHEEGIIGYFAGKNGVGIRVFLNRASSSIGSRAAGKKNLEFRRASSRESRTSAGEAAFSDSYADLEVLDTDCNVGRGAGA